jgi:SNF family Na+-dependent transporter
VSASAGGGVLAVFLVVVLVLGYVVIWAIWHFGFRGRDEEGRRIDKRHDDG